MPTKGLINTPQIADTILKEVDAVMEAIPSSVKALEEVGKSYPFTNGAGPFFRVVVVPNDVYPI